MNRNRLAQFGRDESGRVLSGTLMYIVVLGLFFIGMSAMVQQAHPSLQSVHNRNIVEINLPSWLGGDRGGSQLPQIGPLTNGR